MALDKATQAEINRRIGQGHTYARISKDMKLGYWDVKGVARKSWLAAKVRITNRLKKLAVESNPERRLKLIEEINADVNYLYGSGKALGRTIDGIEKVING